MGCEWTELEGAFCTDDWPGTGPPDFRPQQESLQPAMPTLSDTNASMLRSSFITIGVLLKSRLGFSFPRYLHAVILAEEGFITIREELPHTAGAITTPRIVRSEIVSGRKHR